jgi:hypothetical protein
LLVPQLTRKVLSTYDRAMPMSPAVLSLLLVVMHAIVALPHMDASDPGERRGRGTIISLPQEQEHRSWGCCYEHQRNKACMQSWRCRTWTKMRQV